jgi:predicted transcriptional regulator
MLRIVVNSLGELEREVMNKLWSAPAPMLVRDVHTALSRDRDIAYTTVMTVLERLARKQMVERDLDGRAYRYRPTQTKDSLVAEAMSAALDGAGDNRGEALMRFVDTMTSTDAQALRDALARVEASDGATTGRRRRRT